MVTSKIIEIKGAQPGPVLAIFAGVHGNETAGILALEEMLPTLTIPKGKLHIAFGNPPAIKANARMINKNLNRCFFEGNKGKSPEDIRARQLMKVLDKCDALLDLHMFYDNEGQPFVICEENAIDIANKFDVDIISTNWTLVEPGGTDAYMYLKGRIGVCLECGPISKASQYKDFAKKAVLQFLQYFDMSPEPVKFGAQKKKIIKADKAILKNSDAFKLIPGLRNFDALKVGQVIATEGNKKYTAETGGYIIFPHYSARKGEEAYIIGTE